jgi:hypothetical protein
VIRLSRRDLLAGTGTVTLAAVAGCPGDSDDDPGSDPDDPQSTDEDWRDELDLPESLVSALAYVYQHGNSLVLATYSKGQISTMSETGSAVRTATGLRRCRSIRSSSTGPARQPIPQPAASVSAG